MKKTSTKKTKTPSSKNLKTKNATGKTTAKSITGKTTVKNVKIVTIKTKVVEHINKKTTLPSVVVPVVAVESTPKKISIEKMYFTKDTEDSIIAFNKETDDDRRNEIYNTKIKYAFEKLVENVFNTFKFSYFDVGPLDAQKETLSHLVANISKFEEGKGKAFSYFSIIAKNYLIFNNNSNYKRFNQQVDISEEKEEHTVRLQTVDAHHKKVENQEFMKMMIEYWDENIKDIFPKQRDLKIAEAVIELFRNSDRIDYFNKKALYLYIREISECKTQQITKVINKMKEYQQKITRLYLDTGVV
jgi:hypothetical protein